MVDSHPPRPADPSVRGRRRRMAVFVVGASIIATCLAVPFFHGLQADRTSAVGSARPSSLSWKVEAATPTTKVASAAKPATAAAAFVVPSQSTAQAATQAGGDATAVAAPVATPSISTLITEVEAAGIQPGSNWTWSVGDTATHCGVIAGTGTGCTYGAAGLEYSIFSGAPTLALVAHELANAEVQNDGVPSLLNEVAAAEGGTSWSPTDAVASCLVDHFMGFQDHAAGTWTCSDALAALVAENIHDTV